VKTVRKGEKKKVVGALTEGRTFVQRKNLHRPKLGKKAVTTPAVGERTSSTERRRESERPIARKKKISRLGPDHREGEEGNREGDGALRGREQTIGRREKPAISQKGALIRGGGRLRKRGDEERKNVQSVRDLIKEKKKDHLWGLRPRKYKGEGKKGSHEEKNNLTGRVHDKGEREPGKLSDFEGGRTDRAKNRMNSLAKGRRSICEMRGGKWCAVLAAMRVKLFKGRRG